MPTEAVEHAASGERGDVALENPGKLKRWKVTVASNPMFNSVAW